MRENSPVDNNTISFTEAVELAKKEKFDRKISSSIIINLAYSQSSLFSKSYSENKLLVESIIELGKNINNCKILQATSEAQYLNKTERKFFNDHYLWQKRKLLSRLKKSGLEVTQISIASAISSKFNAKKGLDPILKSFLNKHWKFLLVPNICVKIETCDEISKRTLEIVKSQNTKSEIELATSAAVVRLPRLVGGLLTDRYIVKVPFGCIALISIFGSAFMSFTSRLTAINYERIYYYKTLSKFYDEKAATKRIEIIKNYLSEDSL